jgi:hypothetical protein
MQTSVSAFSHTLSAGLRPHGEQSDARRVTDFCRSRSGCVLTDVMYEVHTAENLIPITDGGINSNRRMMRSLRNPTEFAVVRRLRTEARHAWEF